MKKLIFPALAASLFASVAMADPMATITARQEWYKSLGAVMKPMSELAKAYDAEAVKAEAAKLEAALEVDTSGFYPEGTSATEFPCKTRAKPEIWKEQAKFNDGASWPVQAGHPCIGCSEPEFWDKFTPFYQEL